MDDVRAAFSDLPPVEPGAALDARVRAAVVAELGGGPAAGARESRPSPASGRVIRLPRWRRAALPLATAATLVIAVGLWQLHGARDAGSASGTALESIVASTPVAPVASDDSAQPARIPEALERRAVPAQPPAQAQAARRRAEPEIAARTIADAPLEEATAALPAASMTAAAPAAQAGPAGPAGLASPVLAARAPTAAGAVAADSAKAAAPAAAKRADEAPAAASPPPVVAASASRAQDAATLEEVRRLVAVKRRTEARALLLRWREAHAGTTVPADLQPLLPDGAR